MEKEFRLKDKFENDLNVKIWTPKGIEKTKATAVVQVIHGKGEHVGRYKEFAEYLNTIGIVVIGNDLLGHGKTSDKDYSHFGDKDGIEQLSAGVDAVREYIEEKCPKVPIVMFAHSMGSFIGRYNLMAHPTSYYMACFSGTGWIPVHKLYYALFVTNIVKLFKGPLHISKVVTELLDSAPKSMMKNGLINRRQDWISSDKEKVKEINCDELCNRPFTVAAQRDVLQFIKKVQNKDAIKEGASSTATLFISGEYDAMGEYGFTVQRLYKLYQNAGYSNVRFSVVNGSRHEIINERDRQSTYKTIGDWILEYIKKSA
jgi:alpha-beta hydrolase superfamily lysophospholipase